MYLNELRSKREQVFKGNRAITLTDEDDLNFFKYYCCQFFGKLEDPVELDESLLEEIWEEIKLNGIMHLRVYLRFKNLLWFAMSRC